MQQQDQASFFIPVCPSCRETSKKKPPPEPFIFISLCEYTGTPEDMEREARENIPLYNRKYEYYPVNIIYKKVHIDPRTKIVTGFDLIVEKKEIE